MAVVDSLLKLIVAQGADALIIPSGEPPSLQKGGEPRPLSMPDPGPEFVALVVEEVTDEAARHRLTRGEVVETTYAATDGARYAVRVEPGARGPRVVLRSATAAAEVEAPRTSPPAAPAAPPPSAPPRSHATYAAEPPRAMPPSATRADTLDFGPSSRVDPGALRPVLQRAAYEHASDVILSSGTDTRLRVGGHIVPVTDSTFDDSVLMDFVRPALDARAREELERTGSTDLALEVVDGSERWRFRANIFRQHGGLALALRPVRRQPPTLAELNLPPELGAFAQLRNGLVLMTGTTGSGKSTTLIALIEHINQTSAKHVITLEDPIEYEYTAKRALVHQRQVGTHVDAFSTGLRAALRESPDVILVGEMRDHATIAAALTAAETGHLVLSTLHASSGAMAIDRIIDVFPQHQQAQVRHQLAGVLRAIVTQRLLPGVRAPQRVPVIEILRVNTAVAAKIREGRGHQMQSEIQKGRGEGMIPFEASLADLVRRGLLAVETAIEAADEPTLLNQLLRTR